MGDLWLHEVWLDAPNNGLYINYILVFYIDLGIIQMTLGCGQDTHTIISVATTSVSSSSIYLHCKHDSIDIDEKKFKNHKIIILEQIQLFKSTWKYKSVYCIAVTHPSTNIWEGVKIDQLCKRKSLDRKNIHTGRQTDWLNSSTEQPPPPPSPPPSNFNC